MLNFQPKAKKTSRTFDLFTSESCHITPLAPFYCTLDALLFSQRVFLEQQNLPSAAELSNTLFLIVR